MNNNLDHLIPQSILERLKLTYIDIKLVLTSTSVQGKWPYVKVLLDEHELFNGQIYQSQDINYTGQTTSAQSNVTIKILYYNKLDNDTVVDDNGVIIENQSVSINQFKINNVDIIKTGLIHTLGNCQMQLSPAKLEYFTNNNISTEPTTNTYMSENSVWTINLELPILSFFTKKFDYQELWEKTNITELTNDIYERFLICNNIKI